MHEIAVDAVRTSKKALFVLLGTAAFVAMLALVASVYLGLLFVHSGGPGMWLSFLLAPSYWFLDWNGVKPPFDLIAMLSGQFVYWAWIVFVLRVIAARLRRKA
jgi:hypothetical protein